MRTIIAKFEIEENDVIEHQLFTALDGLGCKDFQKLPDTNKLYEEDTMFRDLCAKVKKAKLERDRYYNNKRLKK